MNNRMCLIKGRHDAGADNLFLINNNAVTYRVDIEELLRKTVDRLAMQSAWFPSIKPVEAMSHGPISKPNSVLHLRATFCKFKAALFDIVLWIVVNRENKMIIT